MSVRKYVDRLNIKDSQKLHLYNYIEKPYWFVKSLYKDSDNLKTSLKCYIHQNAFYGHEYWLKKYSGYQKGPIYSLIEHGIMFKSETRKIGWAPEWGTGSILTFGDARKEMLSELYDNYKIIPIGPRLHYVDVDTNYYNELLSKIDKSRKTIVLYPSHSVEKNSYKYDYKSFYNKAKEFAKENNIGNVLMSLHPSDVAHGMSERYKALDEKIIFVGGGDNLVKFLPRLKAILSVADITYSNKFGSHVGYSIYMGKPHVINTMSDINTNDWQGVDNGYVVEENAFNNAFKGISPWQITGEQSELVDYYFGLSHVRTPKEIFEIIELCTKHFNKYYR